MQIYIYTYIYIMYIGLCEYIIYMYIYKYMCLYINTYTYACVYINIVALFGARNKDKRKKSS